MSLSGVQKQEIIGEYEQNICVKFGGITQADAKNSLELFMNQVMPVLRAEAPDALNVA